MSCEEGGWGSRLDGGSRLEGRLSSRGYATALGRIRSVPKTRGTFVDCRYSITLEPGRHDAKSVFSQVLRSRIADVDGKGSYGQAGRL